MAISLTLGWLPLAAAAQPTPTTQLSSLTQVFPTYRHEVRHVQIVPQRALTARDVTVGGLNQIISADGTVAHIFPPRYGPQASSELPIASGPYNGQPMLYHGGLIQRSPKLVLVVWGFGDCSVHCTNDPKNTLKEVHVFLKEVGGAHLLNSTTQYYEKVGSSVFYVTNPRNTLYYYVFDNNPAPAHPTDSQTRTQVQLVQAFLGVGNNRDVNYVVALGYKHDPPGFPSRFCAYHGAFGPASNFQPYTVFPYVFEAGNYCYANTVNGGNSYGPYDGIGVNLGHEVGETITDPFLHSWFDFQGYENGDKCNNPHLFRFKNVYLNGHYFPAQPLWSNADGTCVL